MTSRPNLPPDLKAGLADHPDLAPADLAAPWRLAEGANPLAGAPAPDPARIEALQATLARAASNGHRQPAPRPALRLVRSRNFVYAVAASVALLLAVGVYLWQQPTTIEAPSGGMTTVDLPDGSRVQLNSGSTLAYDRGFGTGARRVQLTGEAFFDVARADAPFVIETFNAWVQVLGTSFNVRAWEDVPDAETVVAVATGIVTVTATAAPEETVRLTAGQATRIGPEETLTAIETDLSAATAWRQGRFVFLNQPLGVMFDEVERRFGIEVRAPERVRAHVHNIKTDAATAEQLVSELCQSVTAMHLRYRATANGFEVFEN